MEPYAQLPACRLERIPKDRSGKGEESILLSATRRQEPKKAKDDGAARKHRLIGPRLGLGQVDTAQHIGGQMAVRPPEGDLANVESWRVA